ncbi:probable G-protein coupled receptor 156 [Ambystoma mexicanum]|uniref:probable G-protein coupled receptor 156 n=1 Tax=Ambystoma mexicanum TaxID=8296 RepID=UPI0037E8C466
MELAMNCTNLCDRDAEGTNSSQKAWSLLQELCRVTKSSTDNSRISAVLLGALCTLLTCGLLLAIFFLAFTIRFKNNRIVKMSSPNLNVVTLIGSGLTYASGYLFGIQEHNMAPGASIETLIQMRIGMLYLGISLVFGPILGKSWRLYKVFTQRVPDKRVIIKDIQLLGIVAGLLFLDILLLLTWMLSDPVHCVQSLNAAVRMAEKGASCSVTRIQFCTSLYPELWILLLFGFKGTVLIYGTYLAGLTDNVSSPPVNQSLTIMVGVNLAILSAGVVLLVTRFFYAWSNLVFGLTSGGIFLCTTTVNCFIFIPQLMQWRQFEEEHNQSIGQMAKFFNSPSKSFRSMYSEEQIYHLLGENNSMKRLLTEKDAVIESLQEQVNSAKEKLYRLMSAECGDHLLDGTSSVAFPTLVHGKEAGAEDPVCMLASAESWTEQSTAEDHSPVGPDFTIHTTGWPSASSHHQDSSSNDYKDTLDAGSPTRRNAKAEAMHASPVAQDGSPNTKDDQEELTHSSDGSSGFEDHPTCHPNPTLLRPGLVKPSEQTSPRVNYVSSEKLQEILKELSIDTVGVRGFRSPEKPRRASQSMQHETTLRSPEHFRNVCLSLSPYMMRRRRGQTFPSKALSPSSYHLGPLPPHILCMMRKRSSRACNGFKPQIEEHSDPALHMNKDHDGEVHPHGQSRLAAFKRDLSLQAEEESSPPENLGGAKPFTPINGHHFLKRRRSRPAEHFVNGPQNGKRHERGNGGTGDDPRKPYPQHSMDSDSSSSEEYYCCCHRPFCEMCFQNSYDSSDSGTSDADRDTFGDAEQWAKMSAGTQPVVNFKEDLRPTFV